MSQGYQNQIDDLNNKLAAKDSEIDRLREENEQLRAESGLPNDLLRILRDQSVVIPRDGELFAKISEWHNAPTATASAEIEKPKKPRPDSYCVDPTCRLTGEGHRHNPGEKSQGPHDDYFDPGWEPA